MQSKGNAPTAAQKLWCDALRYESSDEATELHHPAGCTAVHNKVHIGQWWVIPLTPKHHREIHAGEFGKNRKEIEKGLFMTWYERIRDQNWDTPVLPPDDVVAAIMAYHR